MLEIKSTSTSGIIKDVDTVSGRIELYLSESNTIDSHNDIMQKGWAQNSINSGKDKPFLWNHNYGLMPLGKFENKEFREDDFGLRAVGTLNKSSLANDLLQCYLAGDVNQHSVGIITINKKNNDKGVRIITEARLLEGSAVVFGSNPNTPVVSLKSATPEQIMSEYTELDERSKRIYKALNKGNLTDEFCELIATEHMLITKKMNDIIEALTKKEPEIITTPEIVTEPQEVKSLVNYLEVFANAYKK